MTIRDFGMGLSGRNHFGDDKRKKFYEEWIKMSDSEKIEFMNRKMEFMNNGVKGGYGFSQNTDAIIERIDARCKDWMKKTPEEKQRQINKWKSAFQAKREHLERSFVHERFGFDFFTNETKSE